MSPRLFLRIASTEARRKMSYRADFWIQSLVVVAAEAGIYWFLWTSVFRESGKAEIAGFGLHGMILYSLAALLVGRLVRGAEFDSSVMDDIYEGGLNRYVVYPTPYFAFKYAQHLGGMSPIFVQVLAFGCTLPFVLGLDPTAMVTPLSAAMALVSIAVASLLYFLMGFSIQGIAFWADNVWSLRVTQRLVTSILGGGLLPLSAFSPGWRVVIDALPFPHLFWTPVTTLLGHVSPAQWLAHLAVALAWCAGFALLSREIFRRGYLQYSGIGI